MLWFLNHFIILKIFFCRHIISRLSCSFANEQLFHVDHDSAFTLLYNINLWVIIFFSFLTLKTNIWTQFGILSSWQLELLAWCCSGEHCCFTASRSRVWSQRLSLVCLHIFPVFMDYLVLQWFPPTIQMHAQNTKRHLQLPTGVSAATDVNSLSVSPCDELGTDPWCIAFVSLVRLLHLPFWVLEKWW